MNNLDILPDKEFEKIINDIDKDCKCIININLQHSFTDFKGKTHIRSIFNLIYMMIKIIIIYQNLKNKKCLITLF